MDKQKAALDASFWINGYQAGLLAFLPEYFDIFVPSDVVSEIEHRSSITGLLSASGAFFREWRQANRLTIQNPQWPVNWFQPGENAAIALALEQGYTLLIDDHNPYHMAKAKGLNVVSTADFAVMLYIHRRISLIEAQTAIHRLGINRHLMRTALTILELLGRARGDG